jgi:peptidyl-tRNA hydrolase, PTH1 family
VVIHDDLDLPPGKVRVKTGGGHGGHNGLKSIEAHVGKEFRRVRLGIGHPGAKELVHSYVLHDFAKADAEWLEPLLAAVGEHAPLLAKGDDASFMNRVHLAVAREGEAGPAAPVQAKARSGSAAERGMRGALADGLKRLLRREG